MLKPHIRIVDCISALGLGNGVVEFPNCLLRDASFEAPHFRSQSPILSLICCRLNSCRMISARIIG